MPDEIPPAQQPTKRKHRPRKAELRVVFDTSALYVSPTSLGSASDLVRQEVVDLITTAKYPDLDILWYLPEVVRHERQYQMQTEALKLRSPINKIERLLGHNLALTDQVLTGHVATKIDDKEAKLGLRELELDDAKVDWKALVHAATYRLPPFSPGEKEKGFRDAIVAETFLQLVAESPKTAKLCRVILVTSDDLLTTAVTKRISGLSNAGVLSGAEDLKGLINTLISDVSEDFIASLKPKAAKLFFLSDSDKETLYFRETLRERITEKFKAELSALPEGTTFRHNGTWFISQPNFARKEGKRIFWTSRIAVEVEAGSVKTEPQSTGAVNYLTAPGTPIAQGSLLESVRVQPSILGSPNPLIFGFDPSNPHVIGSNLIVNPYSSYVSFVGGPSEKKVVTHKGRDVYQVLWSAEVTLAKDLKKAIIEDITHIDLNCQPVS
jgi:hypothetical protein